MRLCSIASGSSGNCIYAGSDQTHLLIDAGISGKRTAAGLAALDLSGEDISGILITHEHVDHTQGLGVLMRKYHKPVYCTKGTRRAILGDRRLGEVDPDLFCVIEKGQSFFLGDLIIQPIPISHDAADPVAYRLNCGNRSLAVMTDLGYYDEEIVSALRGVNAVLLEANHDIRMLQAGPYPYHLKQRILGERGHLSNEACGQLLCEILHDDLQSIALGHLSKENNIPELAYETVRTEVTMSDVPYGGKDFPLYVAKRDEPSEIITVR